MRTKKDNNKTEFVRLRIDTIEKNTGITIRHRDTGEQERKSATVTGR